MWIVYNYIFREVALNTIIRIMPKYGSAGIWKTSQHRKKLSVNLNISETISLSFRWKARLAEPSAEAICFSDDALLQGSQHTETS